MNLVSIIAIVWPGCLAPAGTAHQGETVKTNAVTGDVGSCLEGSSTLTDPSSNQGHRLVPLGIGTCQGNCDKFSHWWCGQLHLLGGSATFIGWTCNQAHMEHVCLESHMTSMASLFNPALLGNKEMIDLTKLGQCFVKKKVIIITFYVWIVCKLLLKAM